MNMEQLLELPIYVSCTCKDCGHKWESEKWTKGCPECNSHSIDQAAMVRGL